MNPSEQIDRKIADHPDWRGELLARIRRLVREAEPEILEELKWRGAPTWSYNGLVCVANIYRDTVKVVFAKGVKVADPERCVTSNWPEMPGGESRSRKMTRSTIVHSGTWSGQR